MDRRNIQRHRSADAIDINDFVHTATGMRVRRLTLPDGSHWFPAVDLATGLGYVNTRQAVLHHVAKEHTALLSDLASSVYGVGTSRNIAGHGLKKSMRMVNLQGLVALVNGSTKPEARPFKTWVSEMVVTVQREGSYSLETVEAQSVTAYPMPQQVADVIVRLEELNVRSDRRLAEAQEEANRARWEGVAALQTMARSVARLADSFDRVPRQRVPSDQPSASAQELLESWRSRLTVTEDVWAVAVLLAPALAESGEARYGVEEIAAGTGLAEARVHDCLRFLIKRQCVRQIGSILNTRVYGLTQA